MGILNLLKKRKKTIHIVDKTQVDRRYIEYKFQFLVDSGYKYKYSAVNQERLFNNLCLKYHIFNVKKYSKTKGEFCITLSHAKKFEKNKNENIQIEQKTGFGIFYVLSQFLTRYGILTAVFVCTVFLTVNCNFV